MITRIHDEPAPQGHRLTMWRYWNPISRQHCYAVELLDNGRVMRSFYEGTERNTAYTSLGLARSSLQSAPAA